MAKNKLSNSGGVSSKVSKVFTPVTVMVYLAVLVLAGSAWAWWHYIYNSPDRVFWDMVGNNLQTSAVTQKSVQDDGQQKVEQITVLQTTPQQLVNSRTTMIQRTPVTRIVTENIGTPVLDYVRYTDIATSQKNTNGKTVDFSPILNKWGKATVADPRITNGQFYSQATLSAIPFGSLNGVDRDKLIKHVKANHTYTVLSSTTQKKEGRTVYNIKVRVDMVGYIKMLKEYADDVGLNQLKEVDATQYESQSPVTIEVQVDGWSHTLNSVSYNDGERVDTFSAYGTTTALQGEPKGAISVEELQYKLQSIQ